MSRADYLWVLTPGSTNTDQKITRTYFITYWILSEVSLSHWHTRRERHGIASAIEWRSTWVDILLSTSEHFSLNKYQIILLMPSRHGVVGRAWNLLPNSLPNSSVIRVQVGYPVMKIAFHLHFPWYWFAGSRKGWWTERKIGSGKNSSENFPGCQQTVSNGRTTYWCKVVCQLTQISPEYRSRLHF